jgi:hypothetical protein
MHHETASVLIAAQNLARVIAHLGMERGKYVAAAK